MDCEEALQVADTAVRENTGQFLNDTQREVFRGAWKKQTYGQIAIAAGYSESYISQEVGPKLWKLLTLALKEPVSKKNFRSALQRWVGYRNNSLPSANPPLPSDRFGNSNFRNPKNGFASAEEPEAVSPAATPGASGRSPNVCDWGELRIDVSYFQGRQSELNELQQWILGRPEMPNIRARLVMVWGIAGIGKTSLIAKLTEQIYSRFEVLFCRSLRRSPPLVEVLDELRQLLAESSHASSSPGSSNAADSSEALEWRDCLSEVMEGLRQRRCLIVLDEVDALLQPSSQSGRYLPGREAYSEWFQQVGNNLHQSCLVLISREQLRDVLPTERVYRSLLRGLPMEIGRQMVLQQESVEAPVAQWQAIANYYGNNPQLLKWVAVQIREFFGGDVQRFLDLLSQRRFRLDRGNELLEQLWQRLTKHEQEVLYWLAIAQSALSFEALQNRLLSPEAQRRLSETLASLQRRSLVEAGTLQYALQPWIRDDLSDRFLTLMATAIQNCDLALLMNYALLDATASDIVREAQIQAIVRPLAEQLLQPYFTKAALRQTIQAVLADLQTHCRQMPGYGAGNLINLCIQLQIPLEQTDFSQLAVWSADLQNTALLNVSFAGADLSRSTFAYPLGNHPVVAIDPTGQVMATADHKGEIILWQVNGGSPLRILQEQSSPIKALAFHPNGRMLASGSETGMICLWDVPSGRCLSILQGQGDRIQCLSFSPDGRCLASADSASTIRLWQTYSGYCTHSLIGQDDRISALAFNADGSRLASSSDNQTTYLWNVYTGEGEQVLTNPVNLWVRAIAFNSEGTLILASGDEPTIRLWDLQTGTCIRRLRGHSDTVIALAFGQSSGEPATEPSANGSSCPLPPNRLWLASSSIDQTIRLWDLQTGTEERAIASGSSQVESLLFSPDGCLLAGSGTDRTVRLWDRQTGNRLRTLRGYRCQVQTVAVHPEGSQLASGSDDGTIRLWDGQGNCLQVLREHQEWVSTVSYNPSGDLLVSGSYDREVRLWSSRSGECLRTFRGHTAPVRSVLFTPDSLTLASCSDDGTVRLWDLESGRCVHLLQEQGDRLSAMAIAPNGQFLASSGYDACIKLWDLYSGECLHTLTCETGRMQTLCFSPDSTLLASSGLNGTVTLWNCETGAIQASYCLPSGLHSLSWLERSPLSDNADTPDSSKHSIQAIACLLGSSGEGQTIDLWDVQTQTHLQRLHEHRQEVWLTQFCSRGRFCISLGMEGELTLWDLRTGEQWLTLVANRPYENMNIAGVKGLSDPQRAILKSLGAIER